MKLLLHACCGPCSIMPTRLLASEGHDVSIFYSNSNISPAAEYRRRYEELAKFGAGMALPVIEDDYLPDQWEREVAPIGESLKRFSPALGASAASPDREGDGPSDVSALLDDERRQQRCRACYRLRLEAAARAAAAAGFDAVATTLAVSPYQFTGVIREELQRAAAGAGIRAHFEDYRPYYDEATRVSRELGMYRQNYCGCRYSVVEGEATRAFVKAMRKAEKAARRNSESSARERAEAELRKERKRAQAEARARKKAILKSLRQKGPDDVSPRTPSGNG